MVKCRAQIVDRGFEIVDQICVICCKVALGDDGLSREGRIWLSRIG